MPGRCRGGLDDARLARAAVPLVGTHDFSSFETQGSPRASSVRTVTLWRSCATRPTPIGCRIEIEANGFLYNMVRSIVGTLVEVGRGVRDEAGPAKCWRPPIAARPGALRRRRDCFCCG